VPLVKASARRETGAHGGAAPVSTPGHRSRILGLRSAAGNRAVAEALGQPRGGPRALARYDTGEHAQMGSDRTVTVNGVPITEAEMTAMGDLYETPQAMYQADKAELEAVVRDIRADTQHYLKQKGGVDVGDEAWEKDTEITNKKRGKHVKRTYTELAKANSTHFAPSYSGKTGHDHKSEWERWHGQALDIARGAKSATGPAAEQALVVNGFASHFLTDAFAAGHLIPKDDTMALLREAWDLHKQTSKTVVGVMFDETTFTQAVAKMVLADTGVREKLDRYQMKLIAWRDIDEERFSEFIYQLAKRKPEIFFDLFIKLVHDDLNATRVEVTNARGDSRPWMLPGDGSLASSPETLAVAQAAVEESYVNLDIAAAAAGPIDYEAAFQRVWAYTPIPTEAGLAHITEVCHELLNPDNPKCQSRFAGVIVDKIDLIISELVAQGYLAAKEDLRKRDEEMAGSHTRF
jgi:hypothetical protein